MKVNASSELKSRLAHAAENGSVIARDILAELKKNVDVTEIVRGFCNHFSTKRKRTSCDGFQKIRIVFTACNKDLSNGNFPDRNNPQAPCSRKTGWIWSRPRSSGSSRTCQSIRKQTWPISPAPSAWTAR